MQHDDRSIFVAGAAPGSPQISGSVGGSNSPSMHGHAGIFPPPLLQSQGSGGSIRKGSVGNVMAGSPSTGPAAAGTAPAPGASPVRSFSTILRNSISSTFATLTGDKDRQGGRTPASSGKRALHS